MQAKILLYAIKSTPRNVRYFSKNKTLISRGRQSMIFGTWTLCHNKVNHLLLINRFRNKLYVKY